MTDILTDPHADNLYNRLPVTRIIELIQIHGAEDPEIAAMTDQDWYELENAWHKPAPLRRLPRYYPAVVRPSDQTFTLSYPAEAITSDGQVVVDEYGDPKIVMVERRYRVRKMDAGDVLDIASIGPQLVETFFGGSLEEAARMPMEFLAQHILTKSLGDRFKLCMHELSEWILIKLCELAYDVKTKEPLSRELLECADPLEADEARAKILSVNAVFFSTLTQRVPAPILAMLRSLTGILSVIGNPHVEQIITQGLETMSSPNQAGSDGGMNSGS